MRRVCRWQVRGAASVLASMANLKFTKVSVAGLQEVKRSSHFSACERSISCDAILLRISARGHRSARDSETPRADLDPAPPGCAFLRYPNVPLGSDRPPQRRIRGLSRQLGFSCLWPKPIGVPTPQNITNVSSKRPKPLRRHAVESALSQQIGFPWEVLPDQLIRWCCIDRLSWHMFVGSCQGAGISSCPCSDLARLSRFCG